MSVLLGFAVVALCACLNRVAGGWLAAPLRWPGRPLWYAAPALALVASLIQPWPQAMLIGVGYMIWRTPEWGAFFDLSTNTDEPGRTWIGRAIMSLTPDDYAALLVRMIVFVMPLALAWPWPQDRLILGLIIGPVFGICLWSCYLAGAAINRQTSYDRIAAAEWLAGALWAMPILLI